MVARTATCWFRGLLLALLVSSLATLSSAAAGVKHGKSTRGLRTRLVPRFYDFSHCKDKEHSIRVANYSFFVARTGAEYWTVAYDILNEAKSFAMLSLSPGTGVHQFRVVIHQCKDKTSSCEYFNTWSWDMAVCRMLRLENMVWSPLVLRIVPPWACPIRPGSYSLLNGTLDFNTLDQATTRLELDKYGWRIEVQLYNQAVALHTCFKFYADVKRIKVRDA